MTKFKTIKTGLSTAHKYPDRPMVRDHDVVTEPHHVRHPNDKNIPRKERGITWSKKTQRDRDLAEFYKTHTYAWIADGQRAWVALPTGEEE